MEYSTEKEFLQPILDHGMEGMSEVLQNLFNLAMKLERENALKASPYQRTEGRTGYANGFKERHIQTRAGELELQIPQTRNVDFYPSCLERGLRSERAINAAMAEMYIQGVATRSVRNILEKLCGLEVSAMQVSRATKMLDEEFEKWRNRPIREAVKYLLLDARYEKVRVDGNVVDCALLIAYGIQDDGHRRVLGVSVELSEAEAHWRKFLESLSERGLHGVEMITSDNHAGLKAARQSVFPSVPWQRCQFHLQQNASAHIPKKSMEKEAHEDIRSIFNMPSKQEADYMLKKVVEKYINKASEFARWLESEIPEGLTVFNLAPDSIGVRRKLRTTNMVEFQNKELKKRTRCIKLFPNKESLLRIATALLIELDETWLGERKRYI